MSHVKPAQNIMATWDIWWPEPTPLIGCLNSHPRENRPAMLWTKMPHCRHYSRTPNFLLRRWEPFNATCVSAMPHSPLFVADQMLHQHSSALFLVLLPCRHLGKGDAGGIGLVLLPTFAAPCKAVSKLERQSELRSHHK